MSPISRRHLLQGAAAAGGLAALGARPSVAAHLDPLALASSLDMGSPRNHPVEHIVVVMMENRSFDHFLGWLPGSAGDDIPQTYLDHEDQRRRRVTGASLAPDFKGCGHPDPDHSWDGGRDQLKKGFLVGRNDEYAIGYYEAGDLPVWKDLTEQATIFDHYFTAVMGPTFPNREYQHAATSGGRKGNSFPSDPIQGFQDTTIWDRCIEKGVSWAYYYSNLPVIGLYGERLTLRHPHRVRHISSYYADAAAGRLPQVCFVDPFFVAPEGLANDDHPHADVRLGQHFLADVIGAFQESRNFASGALFVNYDEWGGFFDTVKPSQAPDDNHKSDDRSDDFSLRGFRTPAAVVSPYAARGAIGPGTYDHTSILKFIEWRFGLKPLTKRDESADNIGEVLDVNAAPNLNPVVTPYVSPPEARIPCPAEEAFEGSDLLEIERSGTAEALGLRTDFRFEHSYRSF